MLARGGGDGTKQQGSPTNKPQQRVPALGPDLIFSLPFQLCKPRSDMAKGTEVTSKKLLFPP